MKTAPTEERISADAKYNGLECAIPGQPRGASGEVIAEYHYGLTKRELFAAMAMQGAMTALAVEAYTTDEMDAIDQHAIAIDAVKMADALLQELVK